ncbi:MAG: CvpA family protein [Bacilli bacterium]|nr:CvpA family protein [Bacilli bacterium]
MNIVDVLIILTILCAAVIGFKRGVLKELVMTVGFLLVFIISFYLKTPLAEWMSLHLPFFNFGGIVEGLTVLNIIFYQLVAFITVFSVIMAVFRVVLAVTGFIEKILKFTIILGIPSKILGAIVGAIEGYIIAFLLVFLFNQPMFDVGIINDSKYKDKILNSTPILTNVVSSIGDTVTDVYNLVENNKDVKNKDQINRETINIMLKHKVISVKHIEKLIEKDKINVPGIDAVLNEYR